MVLVPDPPPGRFDLIINPDEDLDVTIQLRIKGAVAFQSSDYDTYWGEFKVDPLGTTTGDFAFVVTSPADGDLRFIATAAQTLALQTNSLTRGHVDFFGVTSGGARKKLAWAIPQITQSATDTFA